MNFGDFKNTHESDHALHAVAINFEWLKSIFMKSQAKPEPPSISILAPCHKCGHKMIVSYLTDGVFESAWVQCPGCGSKSRRSPNPGLAIQRHNAKRKGKP